MNTPRRRPERILVVGASGVIGRAVLSRLCGGQPEGQSRVTLLQLDGEGPYRVVAAGHVELEQRHGLRSWTEQQPEALLYVAGLSAEAADGAVGQRVNANAFVEALESIRCIPARAIFASSTAVHLATESAYVQQKLQGERALVGSGVSGFALRFPTILPRRSTRARTGSLDDSLRDAVQGRASIWRVSADRRMRVMSAAAAAQHVVAALEIDAGPEAIGLDLPATVVTPALVCAAAGAPEPTIELDPQLEELLARRPVDLPCDTAQKLGFPAGEALPTLIEALKATFILQTEDT